MELGSKSLTPNVPLRQPAQYIPFHSSPLYVICLTFNSYPMPNIGYAHIASVGLLSPILNILSWANLTHSWEYK